MSTEAAALPRYQTEIVAVGEQASTFFDEGIVVLFGEEAPEELADFAVVHRPSVATGGIAPGDRVLLGDEVLAVLAVGSVANDNLTNLGHLVLKRNGAHEAALPGDVCCDQGPIPELRPGQEIRVEAGPVRT